MKRYALALLALVATVGGGAVSAQNSLFGAPNVALDVSFYSGNPADDGALLQTVMVNNSPLASSIPGIDGATYATLEYGDQSYIFPLAAAGTDKNSVELVVGADDETMSLASVLDGLVENPELLEQLQG